MDEQSTFWWSQKALSYGWVDQQRFLWKTLNKSALFTPVWEMILQQSDQFKNWHPTTTTGDPKSYTHEWAKWSSSAEKTFLGLLDTKTLYILVPKRGYNSIESV